MTLFDQLPSDPIPGGVHEGDPETSVEAAYSAANRLRWGSQRHQLLLVFHGRSGLTADEAGELAGVGEYNQRRRCSELVKGGWLSPTGETRQSQRVLRITERGDQALRGARKEE